MCVFLLFIIYLFFLTLLFDKEDLPSFRFSICSGFFFIGFLGKKLLDFAILSFRSFLFKGLQKFLGLPFCLFFCGDARVVGKIVYSIIFVRLFFLYHSWDLFLFFLGLLAGFLVRSSDAFPHPFLTSGFYLLFLKEIFFPLFGGFFNSSLLLKKFLPPILELKILVNKDRQGLIFF